MTIPTLIKQLDELKKELDSYRPIDPERYRRIMQKLQLDWNFHSNSIEGNTLTMTETKQLLYYGFTAKGKPLNDHKEMEGHAKVLKKMEEIIHEDLLLTESLIKEFHALILMPDYQNSKEKDVEINPGHWKKQPNYLLTPTGERLDFSSPELVPAQMNELINWANNYLHQNKLKYYNTKKYKLHPLKVACGFHKRFIDIHPFGDGNGRMARILMNLILMQQGYMPAIVYLEQRQEYYTALNTSTFEDISPLAEYIGGNLIQSMQLAIDGAQGKPVEEQKDWMKELEVMGQILKDREEENNYHGWSIEKQKAVLNNCFIPFVKILYEYSYVFERMYTNLRWGVSKKNPILEKFHGAHSLDKKISSVDQIKEIFEKWHEDIRDDKPFTSKTNNLYLYLPEQDELKGVRLSILFHLRNEVYEVEYLGVDGSTSVWKNDYITYPNIADIERAADEIMSSLTKRIRAENDLK